MPESDWPSPPQDPSKLVDWVSNYLMTHRAHQFTINGVTYPFVRELHLATVPYPINRKYSMLAGMFITRPGDLLFFFQSDPQWSNDDINSRRGLRGIYRVISQPFADRSTIVSPSTKFKILGECPHCKTPHANLSERCIKCEKAYPSFSTPKDKHYHLLVMHLKLDIEPLVVFERAISDERVYADMSDPKMIWIGRHDNQMGIGKGSSIRQLLPEEAVKLARLLITEPEQKISYPKKVSYPNQPQMILNEDGTPASDLEIIVRPKAGDMLKEELMLNFHIACTIDRQKSSIQEAMGDFFVPVDLEYFSTEFPWGYTAGTTDFVCSLAKNKTRYRIIVMELKKDRADDDTVIQTSLYVPWCVQILSQFATSPPEKLEVVPVFISRRLDPSTCRPLPYDYNVTFNSGVSVNVHVESPKYIEYKPVDIYENKRDGKHYAKNIVYMNKAEFLKGREIDWRPPRGTVTSQIERDWVKKTSWTQARKKAGF